MQEGLKIEIKNRALDVHIQRTRASKIKKMCVFLAHLLRVFTT